MAKGFKEEIRRIDIRDSSENTTDADVATIINTVKIAESRETKAQEIDLAALIQNAVEKTAQAYQQQLASQSQALEEKARVAEELASKIQEAEAAKVAAETAKLAAEKTLETVTGLFAASGSRTPSNIQEKSVNFNVLTGIGDSPDGAIAEAFQIAESSPQYEKKDSALIKVQDFDRRRLDKFLYQNREQVIESMESWGRKTYGWFGGRTPSIKEAATTATDLPKGFLEVLSGLTRVSHSAGHVWRQFATLSYDADARLNENIAVPRYLPLASGSVSDYRLSGKGTYAALTTTLDPIATSTVPILVEEFGRGRVANTGGGETQYSPIGIPNFVSYHSAYNLMTAVDKLLGRDYRNFENQLIRDEYNKATVTVYNNGGAIVTAHASIGTGKGAPTKGFLPALEAYMHNNKVLRFDDGCYVIVLPATPIAALAEAYEDNWKADAVTDLQQLKALFLNPEYPEFFNPQVSGYVTTVSGFHVFKEMDTDWGTGASGTAGVTTESTMVMRQGWAFGAQAVGRGVSMPMSYRLSSENDYDRLKKLTWISWEGAAGMDVDPDIGGSGATNQQRRVFKVKLADANKA